MITRSLDPRNPSLLRHPSSDHPCRIDVRTRLERIGPLVVTDSFQLMVHQAHDIKAFRNNGLDNPADHEERHLQQSTSLHKRDNKNVRLFSLCRNHT